MRAENPEVGVGGPGGRRVGGAIKALRHVRAARSLSSKGPNPGVRSGIASRGGLKAIRPVQAPGGAGAAGAAAPLESTNSLRAVHSSNIALAGVRPGAPADYEQKAPAPSGPASRTTRWPLVGVGNFPVQPVLLSLDIPIAARPRPRSARVPGSGTRRTRNVPRIHD